VIKPGILVRDNYHREGIVVGEEPRPSREWIAEQVDQQPASLPLETRWWAVLPLGGGMVLAPEPLLHPIRAATYDDFMTAIDHGNAKARLTLAKLFPDYVRRVVARDPKYHG
jgi:hypothetical protein